MRRRNCKRCRLLGVTLALTLCLTAGSSQAADLVIDDYTYTLDSDVSFNNLYIGKVSTGALNQTGGTNTVGGTLFLGFNSGTSGTYSLSGGIFSTGFGFVGYQGHGVFNQSGGISNIGYNLQLGFSSGSSGTYNLSGGSPAPLILFLEHQNIQGTVHSYIICQSNPRI